MTEKTAKVSYVRAYGKVREIEPYRIRSLAQLVYSTQFELLISAVIIINAVSLAVLTMPNLSPEAIALANNVDLAAYVIYVVELIYSD